VLIVASLNKGRYAPFIIEQAEALRAAGAVCEFFGVRGKGVRGYLANFGALRRVIATFCPDVIHAHYGLCGLLANLQRRIPVVTTYHGSDINDPSVLPLSRLAMRLSAHNIFVSPRTAAIAGVHFEDLREKQGSASRSSLVPCGVDLSKLPQISKLEARRRLGMIHRPSTSPDSGLNLAPDGIYVLFAGAFDNLVKNAPLARAAMALLATAPHSGAAPGAAQVPPYGTDLSAASDFPSGPALSAVPVGSNPGDARSNTTQQLLAPVPQLLELKGYDREQVNLLMNAADVLLMTSHTEGSPQVVKEALAAGCPIVSVDVGDVADLTAGLPGCFIADRTPEDIAAKLALAINSALVCSSSSSVAHATGADRAQDSPVSFEIAVSGANRVQDAPVSFESAVSGANRVQDAPVSFEIAVPDSKRASNELTIRDAMRRCLIDRGLTNEMVAARLVEIFRSIA